MATSGVTAVGLEIGTRRTFAWAYDWPGWCRAGRTDEQALDALATYAPRYGVVAGRAGLDFPATPGDAFDVRERLPGDATTDFGAPGAVGAADREPTDRREAVRLVALLRAAWAVFDEVAAGSPAELRKGPRGGGRDRDKMIDHVLSAEASYARKLGVKHRPPAVGDRAAVDALRAGLLEVLGTPSDGTAPVPKGWPPRYAARRLAWHVLDHAWEMQDRATPG
jgi:hypothetical protein